MLSLGGLSGAALANELDVLNEPPPGVQHIIDDAGVLNKTTRKALNDELSRLEVCSRATALLTHRHNSPSLVPASLRPSKKPLHSVESPRSLSWPLQGGQPLELPPCIPAGEKLQG